MKRTVTSKYFAVCFICVFSSITILGIIFLGFSVEFFERDKYKIMHQNAKTAAGITSSTYYFEDDKSFVDLLTIDTSYTVLSSTINADFLLVDLSGNTVYDTQAARANEAGFTDKNKPKIPPDIIGLAALDNYQNTGVFPSISNTPCYVVGVPVVGDEQVIGILFVSSPADELADFLRQMLHMFLLSAAIVLLLSFILITYFARRMVQPLKEMLDATNSFSQGDFTKRVPVTSYDEIGQLAMAFNNMASNLAMNENSRRSFMANVSHELRTPMTTISGFVDGILDGTIPPEKQNQYLEIVASEVRRLTRLVRSMLDTTRLDAKEMELKPVVFDLSELVRQSIFSFERQVEEKHLILTGLEQDYIMVQADKDMLHQVIYNLVENAVKFVDQGGEIAVYYEEKNHYIYTTIRNTGDGLAKGEASKIFERFYKSDRSRTGNSSGAGLGLHIAKKIITYHNGIISANSVQGEYTEFTFSVPKAPKQSL